MSTWEGQSSLAWIQRNRTRVFPTKAIGSIVTAWVDASLSGGTKYAEKLAEAMAEAVDDEFRRRARIHVGKEGQVVVVVERPDLVFSMRARWHHRLSTLLRSGSRDTGRRLEFRYGDWGVRVPNTKTN